MLLYVANTVQVSTVWRRVTEWNPHCMEGDHCVETLLYSGGGGGNHCIEPHCMGTSSTVARHPGMRSVVSMQNW